MTKHVKICVFLTLTIMFIACTNESIKNEWTRQEENIEKFLNTELKSDSSFRVISNKGIQRLIVKEGTGERLSRNGTVSFYYAGYVLNSSAISMSGLFSTNKESVATAANWKLTDTTTLDIKTINLAETKLTEGLKNGLMGVKSGEECIILFSGKHGFGGNLGTIPANSALAYHIWVESIINE